MLDLFITPWGFEALEFFGVLAGVLSLACFVPYIIDTLRGHTQPDRASWLIWSVLGSISFLSNVYEGATSSLWFIGVQVGSTIMVCLLSIRLGAGSYVSRKNLFVFGLASVGIVSWYLTETAVYALAISILISLVGGLVTVEKSCRDPDSETLSTWVLGLIASVFAALSVGVMDPILLAYPFYLMTLYTAIVGAVWLGRLRKSSKKEEVQIYSSAFERTTALLALPPVTDLAPEGEIFDEFDQFPPKKYIKVPAVNEHVQ